MTRDLPSGEVTFLFTDIEGSTKLLRELDERYSEVLREHRRILRDAFTSHGGVEVDTQGDAFFIAFPDAAGAVLAARKAQEALKSGPVRVRMGLHTGEPQLTEEGYVGSDVHLGARIAAAGHGGQVLLSKRTRDAMGDAAEGLDLGEHRVKDFGEPVWIYQLGTERFPPLKTISNTNLPRPASSFVGRETEVADIRRMLGDGVRLLTLTGTGGTGKTRLAIEAAAELVPEFRNGVFWVDLATVRDPQQVTDVISHTIGASDGLAEHIGERQMLLVLDNLEQVVEAAPDLATLVSACPNLRMLDTSRELLRVPGEVEYAVQPLGLDEAVVLFGDRSGIARDDAVVELCRRLDSLPLAVELAAARTSVLSPRQILERIEERLDLLRAGRGVDPRQQTLRATIEWSYSLLSADEQRLFARMSVFAGGCTLDAAEAVCEADLDILQSLVEKSLVRFSDERFSMLETIRDFAAERLAAAGEAEAIQRRHAEHFLAMAEEAEPHVLGTHPVDWLNRLEREHANIRAALDWLESSGETQLALRLSGALWEFWCLRAHYTEGIRRLATLLRADKQPTLARAKALTGATHLTTHDDGGRLEAWANEAIELYRSLGDAWGVAFGEFQKARVLTERGEFGAAKELLEASVPMLRAAGDEHRALQAMRSLAWCHEELGDKRLQVELTEEILERARLIDDRSMEGRALAVLAGIASDEGRHDEALDLMEQTYRLDEELGDPDEINMDLLRLARVLALAGRADAAVKLLSVREATRPDVESGDPPWVQGIKRDAVDAARANLDERAFSEAWDEGQRVTINDAVSEALESSRDEDR
jgi:predicted ATPase